MTDGIAFTILVDETESGQRLDLLVGARLDGCSRALAANLVRSGNIRVQGALKKPGYRVKSGDEICGCLPPPEPMPFEPEPIDIDILYEDRDLVVVNKPPGLVVHPSPGHYKGTLVHGLLHLFPEIERIGGQDRPGIVHRLDKDTSGTVVVAKNAAAHRHLARQFKLRKVTKLYLALVHGEIKTDSGTISLPIGRHPVDRKRMSIFSHKSRLAETAWRVRERFKGATLMDLDLKTGRTHQIRVHCAAMNHPIVGDAVYGGRRGRKKTDKGKHGMPDIFGSVARQMLHAWRLGFTHPATDSPMSFESPIPQDLQAVIDGLRR
jgi:23S rRNA pseudouridine1911/1915/1917 synthase